MLRKYVLLVVLISLLPRAMSAQSPWPRSKAGFYIQAAWHFIPAYEGLFSPVSEEFPLDRPKPEIEHPAEAPDPQEQGIREIRPQILLCQHQPVANPLRIDGNLHRDRHDARDAGREP